MSVSYPNYENYYKKSLLSRCMGKWRVYLDLQRALEKGELLHGCFLIWKGLVKNWYRQYMSLMVGSRFRYLYVCAYALRFWKQRIRKFHSLKSSIPKLEQDRECYSGLHTLFRRLQVRSVRRRSHFQLLIHSRSLEIVYALKGFIHQKKFLEEIIEE